MQPDYQRIMAERQQQEQRRYQQTRDPFEYGRQVAQRRYSEIMSGLDAQRASTNQSYGDMYQQARQMAVGRRAAAGPTLSGGMGQQSRDFVSTAEMQQLGQIGQAREQANRNMFVQAQSAMSNAQLEGQQATQMQLQNQQTQLQLVQQRQQILADKNLSAEQRAEQLEALGSSPEAVAEKQRTVSQWLTTGGLAVAGLGTAAVGVAKIAGVIKAAGVITSMAAGVGVVGQSTAAASALAFAPMAAGKTIAAGLGLGKMSAFLAASMAAHPVGWAIGAVAVGLVLAGVVASTIEND